MPTGAFAPLVLDARGLACVRGGRTVFVDLSFRLAAGNAMAVVGPNGAGKSSLLRLIAGLLRPEAGEICVEGSSEETSVSHYLGHADALKPALTLRETLRFWSGVYKQQGRVVLDDDIDEAAEIAGVGHALDLHVAVLSAGQRRRAALARLLLSPRPLWLLDEPVSSLDSDGEALLGRLMAAHLSRGGLIVAATHQALPIEVQATLDLGRAQ
jgi:heme exporter protein A